MKFRASSPKWPVFPRRFRLYPLSTLRLSSNLLSKSFLSGRASVNGGPGSGSKEGANFFLVPGATVATVLMIGVLHARRIYDEKKVEEAKEKGIEFEFSPDAKAAFLRLLPLRSISRFWGYVTSMDIPIWLRSYIYKGWARAFHSNLEEIALPLEEYSSLREFFAHALKEGSRSIDPNPYCLVSPVDGTVLRFGELKEPGGLIEQVKGFSYSASSLLGANSFTSMVIQEDIPVEQIEERHALKDSNRGSWWRISLASPKVRDPISVGPMKGVFYCVIYLKPGDYHRVHSPTDWNVLVRRHFSGHLFPQNERATRTIRNLYVENERVVLEGQWSQGYMAIAAIGATNVGSIELSIEPGLKTNKPKLRLLHSNPPDEHVYEPEGIGMLLKKGQEVAAFNMGSTVVLVFQAPASNSTGQEFTFTVRNGERIRMGEAMGSWGAS